jgi:hypothetical protein
MKYAVQMDAGVMVYILSLITYLFRRSKWNGGRYTDQTDRKLIS